MEAKTPTEVEHPRRLKNNPGIKNLTAGLANIELTTYL